MFSAEERKKRRKIEKLRLEMQGIASTLTEDPHTRMIDGIHVSEEEYLYLLRLHAEFVKPEDIQKRLKEKFAQFSALSNSLIRIKRIIGENESKLVVASFRTAYLNKVKDVAIANKRVRVEDLEIVRGRVIDQLKENKMVEDKDKLEFRQMAKTLNETLTTAREEMEGKGIVFNQLNVIGDFGEKTDDELASRRDELIRKAERVIVTEAVNGRTSGADGFTDGTEAAQI